MTPVLLLIGSSIVFRLLADTGQGWDYHYAGWYQRLLGLAEAGWLPVVLRDYSEVSWDRIPLEDVRPREWRGGQEKYQESRRYPSPVS